MRAKGFCVYCILFTEKCQEIKLYSASLKERKPYTVIIRFHYMVTL